MFEIHRSKDPKSPFYWRWTSKNGKILANSDKTYRTKLAAENSIYSMLGDINVAFNYGLSQRSLIEDKSRIFKTIERDKHNEN